MQIKPDEITSILKSRIEGLDAGQAELTEVGTVLSVADGIARVHGLENCMSFEMLEFPHDVTGLALNLESDNVGAVLFGDWEKVVEGDTVKRTGQLLEIPVGEALLGRIVDPLGNPLDGKGEIETDETRPAEFKAPGVVQRQPVKEPMQTGLKAIDSMIPIGRGQRELIIGDRQTGKTAIAIDTIINNKDSDLICVYVAIGQRMSTVVQLAETLREAGALDNTIIVRPPPTRPRRSSSWRPTPAARWASTSSTRASTRSASTTTSPSTRTRTGRCRCCCAARRAARPTRATSSTCTRACSSAPEAQRRPRRRLADGAADHRDAGRRRVGLHPDERDLDHRRPDLPRAEAVLLGRAPGDQRRHLGVARGRDAQIAPMKKVAGRLKLELSQYRDLEAFAQFGSDLDADTQRTLARGERLVKTLNQNERQPLAVEDQVVQVYAATNGFLDRIKVDRVQEFLDGLTQRFHAEGPTCARRSRAATGPTRPRRR